MFNCLHCNKEQPLKRNTSNKYCNNRCQQDYQHNQKVAQWLTEGNWVQKENGVVKWMRRYIHELNNHSCTVCNLSEWNGKPITLEVDHIDGQYLNNNVDNLRSICPNCHSQTETYKAKNKGNGRPNRK